MAMLLTPETIISTLASGRCVRIPAKDLTAQTMEEYAAAAKKGNSHITFVIGDATLVPQTLQAVAADGRGHVTFDFVSPID